MEGFTKFLEIADELDIMIFLNNNQSVTLSAYVYEVTDDTQLILSNPIHEGVLYPLKKSYTYYFRFYLENSGMYLFKGRLSERTKYDNLPSVVIKLESDIKRVQRRKFYRINFVSSGHFLIDKKLSDAELAAEKSRMLKKYKKETDFILEEIVTEKRAFNTLDLSGGGLRVHTNSEYTIGDFVTGEIQLNNSWVKFKGEVIRSEKKESNRYEVGIKFIDLDSITQSKIVAYVFEVERNLIKKGLM